MKRVLSLILFALTVFSLSSCERGSVAFSDSAENGIFIVAGYNYGDSADVPLPEVAERVTEGGDVYDPPMYRVEYKEPLDDYIRSFEERGDTVKRMKYHTLLYYGGCYIFISNLLYVPEDAEANGEPYAYLTVYSGADSTDGGLSSEQARIIIDPESDLLPIDVSPEGMYENTGGQIFMLPKYSYDLYRELYGGDIGDLEAPENQEYYAQYYYVCGESAVGLDMPDLAFADIDGDGEREMLRLGYGPTSGVFTFTVTAYRDCEPVAGTVYQSEFYYLSFEDNDGKVRVKGVPQADAATGVYFDISLSGDTLMLSDAGGELTPWGSLSSLSAEP